MRLNRDGTLQTSQRFIQDFVGCVERREMCFCVACSHSVLILLSSGGGVWNLKLFCIGARTKTNCNSG